MVSKYNLGDVVEYEKDIYVITDILLYNQYFIYSVKTVFYSQATKIQVREDLLKPVSEEQANIVRVLYG